MLIQVDDAGDRRLADYRGVAEPALLRRQGLLVAEGRQVVRALLAAPRFRVRSLLVTRSAFDALGDLARRLDDLHVYVAPHEVFAPLTGHDINRGCLAIAERPAPAGVEDWLGREPAARLLVAAEGIANPDNLGGLFRNALAFGADALLVGPACVDPLYRKTIRVSMGAALRVPFVDAVPWPGCLRALAARGFTVIALTTDPAAMSIEEASRRSLDRVVLVAGSEGAGLTAAARAAATLSVRIPMAPGVDSLNVATATGIALHRLRPEPFALSPEP
jgi:tRNA G18 (ribose-2'-O)-methylase SpoU